MASHVEDKGASNKSVELDLSSVSTIDISSDTEERLLNNTTVTISEDEGNLADGSQVGEFSWANSPRPEIFEFSAHSPDKTNGFDHLDTPTKRPHSPEFVRPDSVKRKYEFDTVEEKKLEDTYDADNPKIGIFPRNVPVTPNATPETSSLTDSEWDLPHTVTRLESPSGGQVYLVGTAHFSKESQEDVSKVIQLVQPHIVTVELCKSRINILQLDEQTILEEASNIDLAKIRATVQQNGAFNGMMYLLLLSMSAHLTKELGMAPGGEFRRAFQEAKKVPHCQVHLGDRPINVTLQRALSSLSWWQTFKLTWHILTSRDHISKEEVEKCKQKDLLEEMLEEMTGEFPALSKVFVHERDLFLAHSLALAAQPIGAVPARVVGVVGIGHVQGIIANWGKVDEHTIQEIMSLPPPSTTSKVIRFTLKASAFGLVVWGAYKLLPVPRITTFLK
ncbi:traB domain-containing protein-like isoform X3 [Neocloeon triangulifer]|nr:traB domain-containing protein-like isoform X3 [Neocloeon triangulifer]